MIKHPTMNDVLGILQKKKKAEKKDKQKKEGKREKRATAN